MRRPGACTPPTQTDFDAVMHANVLGAMQAIPQVAPLVEAAGGVFAFLSSSMSQIGSVGESSAWLYRTSKAALNMAVAAAQHDYPRATLVTIDPNDGMRGVRFDPFMSDPARMTSFLLVPGAVVSGGAAAG